MLPFPVQVQPELHHGYPPVHRPAKQILFSHTTQSIKYTLVEVFSAMVEVVLSDVVGDVVVIITDSLIRPTTSKIPSTRARYLTV